MGSLNLQRAVLVKNTFSRFEINAYLKFSKKGVDASESLASLLDQQQPPIINHQKKCLKHQLNNFTTVEISQISSHFSK